MPPDKASHEKVTMVLSKADLENVDSLHRRLRKTSRAATVGTALRIAESLLRKMDNGCEIYEKHTDGSWSKLKLTKAA